MEIASFPLTFLNVKSVGASLKWGGYQSAQLYFQAAIAHQTRCLNEPVDAFIRAIFKDVCRSVKRGLGPAKLNEGFDPMILTHIIDVDDAGPFNHQRLAHTADMMVIATWFMLREIEVSFSRSTRLPLEGPYVSIFLPVHKTNTAGGLTSRKLRCPCKVMINPIWPWRAAERHLIRMMAREDTCSYMHLFPDRSGHALSKYMVVQSCL